AFFRSANDLVVPTEGGWRIDRVPASPAVPGNHIGCFGPGGNFPENLPPVHHFNFFGRTETATFLARAFSGEPQGLPVIDPIAPLPDSRLRRGATAAPTVAPTRPTALQLPSPPAPPTPAVVAPPAALPELSNVYSDALQLTLIDPQHVEDGRP